jgi:hypothetical protein
LWNLLPPEIFASTLTDAKLFDGMTAGAQLQQHRPALAGADPSCYPTEGNLDVIEGLN